MVDGRRDLDRVRGLELDEPTASMPETGGEFSGAGDRLVDAKVLHTAVFVEVVGDVLDGAVLREPLEGDHPPFAQFLLFQDFFDVDCFFFWEDCEESSSRLRGDWMEVGVVGIERLLRHVRVEGRLVHLRVERWRSLLIVVVLVWIEASLVGYEALVVVIGVELRRWLVRVERRGRPLVWVEGRR